MISGDPVTVAAAADVILFAYPTRYVTEILEIIKSHLKKDIIFVSFSKVRCFAYYFYLLWLFAKIMSLRIML